MPPAVRLITAPLGARPPLRTAMEPSVLEDMIRQLKEKGE